MNQEKWDDFANTTDDWNESIYYDLTHFQIDDVHDLNRTWTFYTTKNHECC
jgi:hypothetical protein